MCLQLAMQRDCGFGELRNRYIVGSHIEAVNIGRAAEGTVVDHCRMVLEVKHIVLDSMSENLKRSRIEARML
jgi:hypothetical protein